MRRLLHAISAGVVLSFWSAAPSLAQTPTAAEALRQANDRARRTAAVGDFQEARQVHPYSAGAIYELVALPGRVSALLLEPGEAITAIAAGDTTRWMVSEAATELAETARAVVLVKPLAANVETNIVIVTDRRTYLIEARTGAGRAYAAEVSWSYPIAPVAEPTAASTPSDAYRIRVIRGRRPVWTPIAVHDDGRRTMVEFAPDVVASDMPPVFVVTGEGAELVNYRVEGTRYIIDRLFDRAELRLGVRSPVVVRIERIGIEDPPRRRRRR